METIQEWTDFYQKMGIEVYPGNSEKTTWLNAFIGKNDIRALLFYVENKSFSYREGLLKKVLGLLQLSETYPWVIFTMKELYIIFRCKFSGKAYNNPPLLWDNTKIVLTRDFHFHGEMPPVFKPSFIDYEVVANCLEDYRNNVRIYDESWSSQLVEDLYTGSFEETWSLKDFINKYGPKMQYGGYPKRGGYGEFWPICRFGDSGKGWKYAYVSLRMREVSIKTIIEKAEHLRIGKLPRSKYYMMYDNSPKRWTDIALDFSKEYDGSFNNDSNYESDDYGSHFGEFSGSYAQDVMGYSDDEINDAFDGDPDAYWNID